MTAKADLYDVIRKPVITEKATMASEANGLVFEVDIAANKPLIKEAVETLVRKRIEKHKNKILEEDSDADFDQNVFSPIDFIIAELKTHQAEKGKK